MGKVYYKDGQNEVKAADENTYTEPASVYITEDWDTLMEDFLDDFDDYQDVSFPSDDEI